MPSQAGRPCPHLPAPRGERVTRNRTFGPVVWVAGTPNCVLADRRRRPWLIGSFEPHCLSQLGADQRSASARSEMVAVCHARPAAVDCPHERTWSMPRHRQEVQMCWLTQRPHLDQPQNQQPAAPRASGCGPDHPSVIGSIILVTTGATTSPKVATSDKGYTAPWFSAEELGPARPGTAWMTLYLAHRVRCRAVTFGQRNGTEAINET